MKHLENTFFHVIIIYILTHHIASIQYKYNMIFVLFVDGNAPTDMCLCWQDVTTPLDEYVHRPDPHYRYELLQHEVYDGIDSYILNMTSQKWKDGKIEKLLICLFLKNLFLFYYNDFCSYITHNVFAAYYSFYRDCFGSSDLVALSCD